MAQARPRTLLLLVLVGAVVALPLAYLLSVVSGLDVELVFVLLILPLAALSIVAERRRIGGLRAGADQLGLRYRGSVSPPAPVRGFELLAGHLISRPKNLMEGKVGERSIALFEVYTQGLLSRTGDSYQAAAFRVPGRALPRFHLRPEGMLEKVSSAFGGQDIDLRDHPEFSAAYRLRGENEEAVTSLFGPVADGMTGMRGWYAQGEGEWTLVYRYGRWGSPERAGEFLEKALAIDELFSPS